jgi:hypothetical protein
VVPMPERMPVAIRAAFARLDVAVRAAGDQDQVSDLQRDHGCLSLSRSSARRWRARFSSSSRRCRVPGFRA